MERITSSSSETLIRQTKDGWLVIFSGFCLYFLLSPLFLWGEFMIYIYSYLRQYDPNSSITCLSWVFPIAFLISQIIVSYTETLMSRISVIKLSFFGFLFTIAALFICSELQNTLYFMLIYSIFIGISLGLLSMLPIVCGLRYFPENKGRVIGLIQLGGCFGCFFLAPFSAYFINSNNLKPMPTLLNIYFNECVANQIPKFLKLIACCYTILAMISLTYIQSPKNLESKKENLLIKRVIERPKWGKALGIMLLLVLLSLEGLFFLMFYKLIGLARFFDDRFLSWVGVFGVSLIWLTRVPWNFFKKTRQEIGLIIIMQILAKISLYFNNSYWIGILMEFGSLAGVFSISSRVIAENFDMKTAKKNCKDENKHYEIEKVLQCNAARTTTIGLHASKVQMKHLRCNT